MSNNDGNIVLSPGEGKMVPVPGHKVTLKAVGADTDGAYSLLEVELYGDGPPQHIHKNEEEAFYVLEGEMNILVGERTVRATAGSFVLVPRGTVHAFSRIGQEPAKFLVTFSPPGFEQFFDDAVALDVTDTEFYRSRSGLNSFEQGPTLFSEDMRHSALKLDGDVLSVFHTVVGEVPERIVLSKIPLTSDWMSWKESEPVVILEPERDYEGADLPLESSARDLAPGRVRQLRDPAIFQEDGKTYLLYSVAGESGIAIAEIKD